MLFTVELMDTSDSPPPRDALLALNRASTTARLLSGSAHEVNNALHVISGTVEMLADKQLPPNVASALERIQRQTLVAAEALASVIVFTRAPLEAQGDVELRETVAHSVALRRFSVRRAGLTMQFDADSSTSFVVRGNRGRLQQAVLNLIINAEQALAGTAGTIVIRLSADETSVSVRVSDNGPGIDTSVPLFKAFAPANHPDGTGLGLWASRALVESCGGTLSIEPAGPGTHAVITLPRAR
jgi:two-component system NtrC family sensor kinase